MEEGQDLSNKIVINFDKKLSPRLLARILYIYKTICKTPKQIAFSQRYCLGLIFHLKQNKKLFDFTFGKRYFGLSFCLTHVFK